MRYWVNRAPYWRESVCKAREPVIAGCVSYDMLTGNPKLFEHGNPVPRRDERLGLTTIPMGVKFPNRSRALVKYKVGENPLNRSASSIYMCKYYDIV